jgi:hypothetical protein
MIRIDLPYDLTSADIMGVVAHELTHVRYGAGKGEAQLIETSATVVDQLIKDRKLVLQSSHSRSLFDDEFLAYFVQARLSAMPIGQTSAAKDPIETAYIDGLEFQVMAKFETYDVMLSPQQVRLLDTWYSAVSSTDRPLVLFRLKPGRPC